MLLTGGQLRASSTADADAALTAWSFALAVGVLVHELQAGRDPISWHGLVVVAAAGVLVRPDATGRLLVLAAAWTLELLTDLPDPWNHTVLLGVLGAGTVGVWVASGAPRPSTMDRGALGARVAPLFRSGLVVVWFAAALAKLNEGFFEAGGCSVWMVEQLPGVAVPGGLDRVVATTTVAVELAIPVLLLVRRTRPIGVALAVCFHVGVAVAGHAAFSGLALSIYAWFLAPDVVAAARRRVIDAAGQLRESPGGAAAARLVTFLRTDARGWALAAAVAVTVVAAPHVAGGIEDELRRWGPCLLFLAWATVAVGAVARELRHRGGPVSEAFPPLRFLSTPAVLVAIVLVANAASPYLGLKSLSSFTMYSDLRTEPDRWNHLVVPEGVRIFGWQDDVVELVRIDDPGLVEALDIERRGPVMPALRVRVLGADHGDARVVYRVEGRRVVADPLSDDDLLGSSPSTLQRLFGGIRPVDPQRRCMV